MFLNGRDVLHCKFVLIFHAAFLVALALAGSGGVVLTSSTIFAVKSGLSRKYAIAASDPWAICSPPKASQLPRLSTTPRASAASRTEPSHEMPHE